MPAKVNVDISLLKQYYLQENLTREECASKLNVSLSTIYRVLKENNIQKTKEQRYQRIAETLVATNLTRYGVRSTAQLPEVKAKQKKTCQERYGVENVLQQTEIRKKIEQTQLHRYGVKYYVESLDFKQKARETSIKKYGVEYPTQNPIIRKKAVETCLIKYGVENPLQNLDFIRKKTKKYTYQGITFDSSWELALWIYAKEHNEDIVKEPLKFCYQVNGKKHYYIPDFMYNGMIIDIKGNHLVNSELILIDKFNNEGRQEIYKKNQCLHENHVEIWTYDKIKFALDYVKKTYGKNYLQQFRNSKNS